MPVISAASGTVTDSFVISDSPVNAPERNEVHAENERNEGRNIQGKYKPDRLIYFPLFTINNAFRSPEPIVHGTGGVYRLPIIFREELIQVVQERNEF